MNANEREFGGKEPPVNASERHPDSTRNGIADGNPLPQIGNCGRGIPSSILSRMGLRSLTRVANRDCFVGLAMTRGGERNQEKKLTKTNLWKQWTKTERKI